MIMTGKKYDHTHVGRIANALECTKIANHRFGLERALTLVLQGPIGIGGQRCEKMVEAAKNRDLDEFSRMLTETITAGRIND
jgi:hypothetical protein